MAFADEAQSTGFTLSESSLKEPHVKFKNVCSSFPVIKPTMSKEFARVIKKLGKVCHQGLNRVLSKHSNDQKDTLSLDESKYIIRELAAELNRVVQFKKFSLMFGKMTNKDTKEEQQYYILKWAEELETLQRTQMKVKLLQEKKLHTPSEKSRCETKESEINWNKAKEIMSHWAWRLKEMKENSVCPTREYRETLSDLYKQCKQRESSILPVMDWMMWTVLQSESSEDFPPEMWMKKKQRSKNSAGLRIHNSVWDWITKSKALVVLDPNTANPDLLVSKDGKSVRASNHSNNWEGFELKRSQFNGWTCVQAKEGYITGRHYWEVDVQKKYEWRLGVVKESAPRNGYVNMNTKQGFWNLRLQLGTLIALTEPVTKLCLPTPSKIGVYLDIEEGQVSFYNAEERRHIYTFVTDFNGTENIYPMFGTIETDKELVIL